MTIKRISIPKIPHNLTIEQVSPILNKLRQAMDELQQQALAPIDGKNIKFGTVTEEKIEPELLIDVKATRFYIEPTNGTSIKNSSGTLTIRAVQVNGFGTTLLTAGPIKMFKPDGSLAGNGYTWTATASDINDSIVIILKHETEQTEWDSITLIDITDGGDAVIGAVDATNGLVWTRAIDAGSWTPGTTTTDLVVNFYRLGVSIADRTVRVTLNTTNGTLTAALVSNNGEPTTHAITGSGTETLSVTFTHTASGASVIEAVLSVQGGFSGLSTFVANVYQRSATPPSTPSVDDGSYDFTNNVLTPPSGWSVAPPAGADPLYVSTGSFSILGPTGTDNTVVWTSPDLLVQDGTVGNSVFVAAAFLRKATAPTKPIDDDGSYDFGSNILTPPSTGGGSADDWFVEVPAGSDPLYVVHGTFEIAGTTGADGTVVWTTPQILASDGATGATGGDGNSVFVGQVFLRKATAPTEPINDDGSYNFSTNILTPPSTGGGSADDWFVSVPAGNDPLYVCSGTFEINGTTGTDNTVDWTAPVILASDGADGAVGGDGLSVHVSNVYQRSATPPATPTGGSYNFTTNTLTPPSGWSVAPPAGADPLYVSTASWSIVGTTGIDSTTTWTSPDILVSDGADGTDGASGVTGFIEPENGLAWTRATTGGAWTPSQLTTNLDCTFRQDGADVARIARRITLTEATGALASSTEVHKGGDQNTGRVTVTVSGATLAAITVQFDYSFGGFEASVAVTVESVQGGDDGVLHYLTNEAHVIPSKFDGTGYDDAFPGAGGTHKLFEGTTDETTNATHSVVAPATKNGLTIAVVAGTGVYSLSGAVWTTELEVFTLRAVFNGVNYDKEYTIAKAKQGTDGGCDITDLFNKTITRNQSGGSGSVGYRAHLDGTIDTGSSASPIVWGGGETWIGGCANSQYECKMTKIGGANLSGEPLGVWLLLSTTRAWTHGATNGTVSSTNTFEIRRIADNKVLKLVTVAMSVDSTP